ncbi:MAG: SurA N-terminal domain-containing protein [Bacteroidales bacterium]|jgi:peptidyl-prolyl cis-trans isomerase D|nr:SurA N-terminal domain-containing protein [Bacteroidales bacterium]
MAAIGSIRKHGILLMGIIGIALLAFVMGDVSKLSTLFSDKYTMVKINGNKFDNEYRTRLEQNTALWKIFYDKSTLEESETYQIHEMTWSQLLDQTIIEAQLKDLGLQFTKDMIAEIAADMVASLHTQQPNQLLSRLVSFLAKQASTDMVIDFISNIEDHKNDNRYREIYGAYKAIERFATIDQQRARYLTLAQNTVSFSDEAAKFFASNNTTLLTQAVTFYPTATQFNEIEPVVADKEIKNWFEKNKIRYQIKENSRDIDVAIFPIQPSPEDLSAIHDTVLNRAARLKGAPSLEEFHISMMMGQLDSTYFKRSEITIDTLAKLIFDRPVGSYIEPFEYENIVWYYGKSYGSAKRSDSVNVAFLVVDFKNDRNPAGSIRTKDEAKKLADSLKVELQKGGNVFTLLPDYLGGRETTDTTYWASEHSTFPELYNSLLTENVYVQDAPAAYVVYKVIERTTPVEKRLFVIYQEEIKPSDATIKHIRNQAMHLQAECSNAEDLMTSAAQQGTQVVQGKDVTPMMANISNLQNTREIISWAFNPDTKLDDVSDIYNINNNFFAVAAIRSIKVKGDAKLADVRETIEGELKAKKKLELIQIMLTQELNNGITLQQLAEKNQVSFMDSVTLVFGGETYQNRNIENVAIGKIFALPAGEPTIVTGKNNLYAISIYEKREPTEPSANFAMEKSMLRNAVAGRSRNENTILEGLKAKATLLDQRYLYFTR